MDIDTAVSVLNTLDEAERLLAEVRLHPGACGAAKEFMDRNRELLDQARRRIDSAHDLV
ncbi:hypothetical protein [Azospirillum isscasi]|uniref:Uncharacterized protein n=1 Tax=Azospirillum isscasi TaxID=3053926 RepID=A0ABU0WN20_9PROT|nr:hypothetical protein [Azospirillum isscasi]MDQ2105581.1 hypothetical protein [Azospirillum isscasi]